jgi:hypothetical protein
MVLLNRTGQYIIMTINMTNGNLKKWMTTRLMSKLASKLTNHRSVLGTNDTNRTKLGHAQQKEGQMDELKTGQSKKTKKGKKRQWKWIVISINIWFV